MRCARCGNENPETNRFCGMCGAKLLEAPAPAAPVASPAPPFAAAPNTAMPAAPAPRHRDRVSESAPIISGPSFLGLNQPAPSEEPRRASLSIDPKAAPSTRNLDYLLEDEEPKRGGGGKFTLILIALLLAVGMGYLRWKNQGFAWLNMGHSKPSAAAPTPDAPDASAPSPSSNTTPNSAPTPAPLQPATGNAPQPAADGASSGGNAPGGNAAASPAPGTTQPTSNPAPGDATPASGATNSAPDSAATPKPPVAKDSDETAPDAAPAKIEELKPAQPDVAPKSTAIKPPKPADPVSEAQKYIYGKGAKQDCDRGMRLLKPAANQANPRAMIEMGALYSAGLCTPRDLPTAYRWFALALRKQPDNEAVQTDLQKLWGEMTQPERQLAIKLSH